MGRLIEIPEDCRLIFVADRKIQLEPQLRRIVSHFMRERGFLTGKSDNFLISSTKTGRLAAGRGYLPYGNHCGSLVTVICWKLKMLVQNLSKKHESPNISKTIETFPDEDTRRQWAVINFGASGRRAGVISRFFLLQITFKLRNNLFELLGESSAAEILESHEITRRVIMEAENKKK